MFCRRGCGAVRLPLSHAPCLFPPCIARPRACPAVIGGIGRCGWWAMLTAHVPLPPPLNIRPRYAGRLVRAIPPPPLVTTSHPHHIQAVDHVLIPTAPGLPLTCHAPRPSPQVPLLNRGWPESPVCCPPCCSGTRRGGLASFPLSWPRPPCHLLCAPPSQGSACEFRAVGFRLPGICSVRWRTTRPAPGPLTSHSHATVPAPLPKVLPVDRGM